MAEQALTRRPTVPLRTMTSNAVPAPTPPATSQESMRRAMSCLDAANRRLKRGEAGKTDEVLNLLRAATAHLQQACAPTAHATELNGAE